MLHKALEYCVKNSWTGKRLVIKQNENIYNLSSYQVNILTQNKVKQLLPVEKIQINQVWWWQYEIQNKISWQDWAKNTSMKKRELNEFYQSLYKVFSKMEEYLLDIDSLLLKPAFIFKEENEYYFCSYPPGKRPFKEQVEELNDFIDDVIDIKDRETVKYTYKTREAYKKL